ncbi:MAG TPA: Holliday junction resolvase RuvX [Mycobacteriales bacterium]|jgi:putative Holliday junction resolvase|nr:Holliday junction resolvase RuvX [Mycobacteriales bacterium]
MRRGVRLGIDVGSVRVGVAASDPDGMLATPIAVLRRDAKGNSDLSELARITEEREALEVVIGLPRSLSGREGKAAQLARDYATSLAERVAPVSVRLVDERLSTVEATRGLQQAGVRAREGRSMVDAAAATVILQHALDAERQGVAPGEQLP